MPEETKDELFEENDSSLVFDMDAVEESSWEILPKGTYDCIIEDAKFAMSKSSNKPMWNVTLAVVDGEYANRKLFTYISFSEKALPMTKKQLNRIAPDLISKTFDPKKIADEGSLVGIQVRAKIIIEPYEGENKNKVTDLLAPTNGGGNDFLND